MKKFFLTICLALFACMGAFAQNEVITNQTVLDLIKEGFTTEEIMGALENSTERRVTYDINFMRQLKEAGADTQLTTYLQKIAKADNGLEGIVWFNTGGKPKKLLRSQFEKEAKGFNLGTLAAAAVTGVVVGSAVSGSKPSAAVGAATGAGAVLLASTGKDIDKLCLMGVTSKMTISSRRPVFRFYLPKTENNSFEKEGGNYFQTFMNKVQSPNEFQVVKMKQKKNRRVFVDGASYSVAGFEGTNAKNRVVVNFEIEEINNNTFEITFPEDMEPGEYVFFWKNGLSDEQFRQNVFGFDFTIE